MYLLQAILISHCRNMIFLFLSWLACLPEFINISTFVISNLPILAPIFCHALYGYPSLKPILSHIWTCDYWQCRSSVCTMFKTDSFILQIWLRNFVWLLVHKWNTVIRTAKFYPFNPSWLLNLVKKGCNSKLVKESELWCYQKITVVIILKLLKCQRLESELF